MKIALLNIHRPGDNKDYNGGFGTTWQISRSFLSRVLERMRSKGEYFPLVSYGYLAAILKQSGHEVEFVENRIPENFDLVILHGSTIRYNEEIKYLKEIREKTKSRIGIVGPFASTKPELFKDYSDFVVLGEPEQAMFNLKDGNIPSGLVKSEPITDLDTLPYPDWSIFPIEKFSYSPILPKKPFTFVISSKGCPYTCSYCPYKVFGLYRARDPLKVVDEIEHLQKKYGVKGLMFRDPMFSLNPEKAKIIAEEIIKRGIKVEWGCETRLDKLDKAFLDLLYDSGLRAIKVGIESVSNELLEKSGRKTIKKEHQKEIISYCDKKGIRVIAFYIIGLPDDTEETIKSTMNYAKKLNTDFANFTLCTPIPGTKFFEEIKEDITTGNWEEFDNFHAVFRHKNLTKERLLSLQEKAITGYYFRPKYILKHVWRKITR